MLMLSLFQKKGVLLHTTLFLSLFSALLLEVEADVTPLRHSHIDFQQVFRNRSFCLYQPTGLEIIFNMTLLLISSLCSLGLIIHFAFIKGLGERPGDILFMVSIGDLLSTANQVMMNVYCLNPDNKFYDDNLLYTFSNYVDVIVENIVNFYYISFCIFHLLTLKRALKGPGIPSFFYHLAPLMMAGLFSYGSYAFKGLESVWFCFHGFGLTAEIILSVSKYVVLACMTLALAKQIKSYLPEYRKIYEVRLEFLDYYSKYLTTLRYVYIGKGIVGVVTSLLISHGLNENTSRMLNIAMLAGRMMTGTFPIILSLARFNDPLIKKYWNGIIHGTVKEEKTGEILDLTGKKGKLELASALIEKSLKIKPQLQQIRYCRKVQVVYSILSGIHYFWHMRGTGKLPTNSKKRRISLLNEVKDSELRNEKFKVKHIIKMKNNHLKKEVPQIFNEIKSRGYNLAQGKFTCYAQEAFSEIIKLDKAENEITKSLDLKENLSRISGSGLNKAGKSGEFFFFSKDNKFVIKTICRKEVKTLLKILPKYIEHYKQNPHSFIVRIYGIFSFKVGYSYEKYHFILMRNLNDYPINWVSRKYDLKGSTVGRRTIKNKDVLATELHTFDTLKDLDFNRYEKKIPLDDQLKSKLLGVLKADVDFLKTMGLIDYSLILYIIEKKEDNSQEGSIDQTNCSDSTCDSETKEEHNPFTLMESRDGKLYYKIGIIDYLTEFGFRKRLEIFIKKLAALNPNHNISAQRPHYYGERFLTYLTSLFD